MVPSAWKLATIESIADVASGGTPSRKEPKFWGGSIPWVTTAEVQFGTIYETAEKITESGLANSSAKLFPPGTILMAMYGQGKTRGQVAKLGIEAATNQACAAILLRTGCDVEYYFQFLMSRYEHIREMANSGGQENLSAKIVKSIQVPVPSLPEQKKIAQILSTWDDAITTTEKLLANCRRQSKALTRDLLTGKRRLHGFAARWKSVKLGTIFSRVTTKNSGHKTNVVTISGQHGLIRQEQFFKKKVASATLEGYFLLKKGQFAYNKSYSNGYPMGAIKRLNRYEHGVVTTLYICFELSDPSRADGDYFEHYFEAGLLNRGLSQIAHEGGRAHGLLNVKPNDFFGLDVVIPSVEEQRIIARILSASAAEVRALQKSLDLLTLEKKALMHQLLTGKRRVKAGVMLTIDAAT